MCTFTIVTNEQNRIILTSSRDEQDTRKASFLPNVHDFEGQKLLYAKDADAGGTWLGVNAQARVVCLLNGAFVLHERTPPYKHSRGFVVLEALVSESFEQYISADFMGIEPFTLVSLDLKPHRLLQEFRWDGQNKHHKILDLSQPQMWSSATLYTPEVAGKRRQWFDDWCSTHALSAEQMLAFHSPTNNKAHAPEEAIFMRRKGGGTVSLTSLDLGQNDLKIKHHNFVTNHKLKGILHFVDMRLDKHED